MKTILVTGAAGFLGTNLIKVLDKKNYIICIDNLSSSNSLNLNYLKKLSNVSFINHDIRNKLKINHKIDEIYNFACPASPSIYQRDPIGTFETNVTGTKNIIEFAIKNNSKIFQASTSEVYGDPLEHPQKETYFGNVNPIGIRSCYDEGKRGAESIFFDYYRKYNLKIKVARIFNTYGPGMNMNDGRVVSNFIVQALKKNAITLYGNGNQTRSFCFVLDTIYGIKKLMNSKRSIVGPINIGNPKEISVKHLAILIRDIIGNKVKIIYKKLPIDDPKIRKPDIQTAKKVLNWKPKTNLNIGLKKTINYFERII